MKAAIVFVISSGLLANLALAQSDVQPDGHHSSLTAVDGTRIEDAEFARAIKTLMVASDGKKRVRNAALLFQTSLGGGMLDDLRTTLTTSGIPVIAASASKHDDPASGSVSELENMTVEDRPYDARWVAEPPLDAWTGELARPDSTAPGGIKGELLVDQTLLAAVNTAASRSAAKDFDTAQVAAFSDGSLIRLVDSRTKTHHAVLWAGVPDRLRVFNDIASVREALARVWRNDTYSIVVLFGDGEHKVLPAEGGGYDTPPDNELPAQWHALEATADNLKRTLEGLPPVLDGTAQFFFYATSHATQALDGCGPTFCPKTKVTLPKNGGDLSQRLTLSDNELATFLERSDALPVLRIAHSGKVKRNAIVVEFNEESLGLLSPTASVTEFTLPQEKIGPANTVRIHSHNPTDIQLLIRMVAGSSVGTLPVRDCNADRIDDAINLIDGSADDINQNNIPDKCESGRIRKPGKVHMRPESPSKPSHPVRPPRPRPSR